MVTPLSNILVLAKIKSLIETGTTFRAEYTSTVSNSIANFKLVSTKLAAGIVVTEAAIALYKKKNLSAITEQRVERWRTIL